MTPERRPLLPFTYRQASPAAVVARIGAPLHVVARFDTTAQAVVCSAARLLWRGVTNDVERKALRRYAALLPDYEISAEVWKRSIQLADRARASGVTVPLADLLIFACAKIHGLEVTHDDTHFDELSTLEA